MVKLKKFTSYDEAIKFSNNIQCFYDEERYKEAVEKNNQIKYNAEQKLKCIMKERLGIASNDKLDNAYIALLSPSYAMQFLRFH